MPATRAQLAWPIHKVGLGEALTKERAAARLGVSKVTFEARKHRRQTSKVPLPAEDGWAFHPDPADTPQGGRDQPIPFWYERTIIAYGVAVGDLNRDGSVKPAAA